MHFEVYVDPGEVTLRLGSAVIFGLLLGIDREVRGYDAGMRTHMLVALGAAVMTLIRRHQAEIVVAHVISPRPMPIHGRTSG